MPRDGSTVFHKPFPDVIDNTTIESAVYNGFVNDIEGDLNNPRPILSGGTGANNARDAMLNLKGEIALQSVSNFDSHPWVTGSFYSAAGATAAPNGVDAFAGIYFQNATGDHATIHARANTPQAGQPFGKLYIRQKIAGVWQPAWTEEDWLMDTKKVDRAGDVMTGDLAIDAANPAIVLDKAASTNASYVLGQNNALARWRMDLGDNTAESGTQIGSDLTFRRYTNAGNYIDTPLRISRETGMVTMPGSITVGGTINTTGTATFSGPLTATNITATGTLTVNGASTMSGPLSLVGDLTTYRPGATTTGYVFYGNAGGKYLGFNGTQFDMAGGALQVHNGSITASTSIHATTSLHALTSGHIGTTLNVGGAIAAGGGITGAGHSTFGNLTANGGVVYLNSVNSDYIQASNFVLNYRGQIVLHSGNYTNYFPASVTSQYWAHVGDTAYVAHWYTSIYEQFGAHAMSAGAFSAGSNGHTVRHRVLYNVINGTAYVVGAAS